MNTAMADPPPIYAVVDRRSTNGKLRILAEYVEPESARQHALLMAWAGDSAEVVLLSTVEADES